MMFADRRALWAFLRTAVSSALCVLLFGGPVVAEAAVTSSGNPGRTPGKRVPAATRMEGDARIVHALNRFTFGPRPGDVEAVRRIGLNRWFEQQLEPATIDDAALDARLADDPAMRLPVAELEARYPGGNAIRRLVNGKIALPNDPQARLLVEDEIELYKLEKAKREAAAAASVPTTSAAGVQTVPAAGNSRATSIPAASDEAAVKAATAPVVAAPQTDPIAPDVAAKAEAAAQAARLAAMAPDKRLPAALELPPATLLAMRNDFRGGQLLALGAGMTPQQREMLKALGGSGQMVSQELLATRVLRDVYTSRQLEAVMTDFWLNHFNIFLHKNEQEPYLLTAFERDTIRPHALGKFEDLLDAVAESPAMLVYLDQAQSTGPDSFAVTHGKPANPKAKAAAKSGLNENYGRELMELHTVGVNGGYTQADVTEVAKVFTGWTVQRGDGQTDDTAGTFAFNEKRHEPGPKTVLGRTIPEDGFNEGLAVLHQLATSPATAHFLSEKLAVRFVSDTPPPALVDRMAATFLANNGDMRAVLRTLFLSPEFWQTSTGHAKVKTPEEFAISAVRASGADVNDPAPLVAAIDRLGMPLYGMQTPNGYGWTADEWVSTGALVSRMNFALVLAGGRLNGTKVQWSRLAGDWVPAQPPQTGMMPASMIVTGPTAGADAISAKEHRLESALLAEPASERTRATILAQANNDAITEQAAAQFNLQGPGGKGKGGPAKLQPAKPGAAPDDPQAAVMAGLMLGSPEFQRR